MSKKAIGWLYFSAVLLQIILGITFVSSFQGYNITLAKVVADQNQIAKDTPDFSNDPSNFGWNIRYGDLNSLANDQRTLEVDQATMIVSGLLLVVAGILGFIAWIGTLINLSRAQAWAWFVLTFFFSGIMIFIYLLGGPTSPQTRQYPQAQPAGTSTTASGSYQQPSVPQAHQLQQPQLSALEILQQRYVRGEIDTPTFQQMRALLEAPSHSDS